MSTLPFIEDTQGQKWKRQKYKDSDFLDNKESSLQPSREHTPNTTTALSYDEVTDDLDEIVALRGEGRYFGVTDPDDDSGLSRQTLGPLCANCHKRGHIRAKCKVVVCHKCGAIDDHYESQCPTTIICARCGEKGHTVLACKSKVRKRQYCRLCDSFKHGDENCPSIWRSYIVKPSMAGDEGSDVLPRIFCYNCGSDEHYGDECHEQRKSRIPNFGSAFSGNNLPKEYRDLYFRRLRGEDRRADDRRNYNNPYLQNYGDEEYDPAYVEPPRSGFGSKNFYSNKNNNNNTTQPVKSGVLPNRKLAFPKGPGGGGGGGGNASRGNGSFLKAMNEKTKNKKRKVDPKPLYTQPTRSGTISRKGSANSNGNKNRDASSGGVNYTAGGSKPTRSGLIGDRKAQNLKRMKY
ncbi:Protein AIR1 [Candida viswanathii]|uniref:Protein AIR1 n=1 Tax=Candida viswanathii TaxID=5486 RepID=A0A367YGA7_9ASCO|nr:Protein AIR1 [Candida viswanathii]